MGLCVGIVFSAASVIRSLYNCDVGRYVVEMPGLILSTLIDDDGLAVYCVGFSTLMVVDGLAAVCVGFSNLIVVDGLAVYWVDGLAVYWVDGCLVPTLLAAVRFANFDGYAVAG